MGPGGGPSVVPLSGAAQRRGRGEAAGPPWGPGLPVCTRAGMILTWKAFCGQPGPRPPSSFPGQRPRGSWGGVECGAAAGFVPRPGCTALSLAAPVGSGLSPPSPGEESPSSHSPSASQKSPPLKTSLKVVSAESAFRACLCGPQQPAELFWICILWPPPDCAFLREGTLFLTCFINLSAVFIIHVRHSAGCSLVTKPGGIPTLWARARGQRRGPHSSSTEVSSLGRCVCGEGLGGPVHV